ncbi:MAG TPA: hypothetical protein VNN74_05155 [Candidatus Micrarchaeia archaeon]|nr:hypothetical protein [Candidatus Micrarchaeia archaeon]
MSSSFSSLGGDATGARCVAGLRQALVTGALVLRLGAARGLASPRRRAAVADADHAASPALGGAAA